MDFFERFKDYAEKNNTTIDDLMRDILGKNRDAYYGWRKRNTLPRADEAVKIAAFMKTSVEFLVTGQEPAHISPKLSQKSLEIARAAEKLDDFGKQSALDMVIGLELTHPLGRSGSTGTEN
jgi:hypothetical protein